MCVFVQKLWYFSSFHFLPFIDIVVKRCHYSHSMAPGYISRKSAFHYHHRMSDKSISILNLTFMCFNASCTGMPFNTKCEKTGGMLVNSVCRGWGYCIKLNMSYLPQTQLCITMTSWWSWWRLRSPASQLFTQQLPFIQTEMNENIKVLRPWALCGEFTGGRWIPRTKGQLRGKVFHLMTSSCNICIEQWLCCIYIYIYIYILKF